MERYRQQGLTASLEALQTMYPGVNMTDILMEDLGEEAGEMEGGENELQGSEGEEEGSTAKDTRANTTRTSPWPRTTTATTRWTSWVSPRPPTATFLPHPPTWAT